MNGQNLDAIQNARIHRLMSKLLRYRFRVLWMPGKTQSIADALSRSPVFEAEEKSDILICTVRACLASQEGQPNRNEGGSENVNDLALVELIAHAKADQDYQKVLDAVHRHKDLRQLPRDHPAQSSRSYWDSLAVEPELPGLILYRSTYHFQARDPQDPTRSAHKGDKNSRKCMAALLLAWNDKRHQAQGVPMPQMHPIAAISEA